MRPLGRIGPRPWGAPMSPRGSAESPAAFDGQHYTQANPPTLSPGAVFSNCSFHALHWHRETLQGVHFSNCRFESVRFEDCQAEGIEWGHCTLTDVHWRGGALRESQLHDSSVADCGWHECALEGVHLSTVRCRDTRFVALEARHLAIVTSEVIGLRFESCRLTDTSWIRGTVQDLVLQDCACLNLVFGQLESTQVRLLASRGRNLRWIQCQGTDTALQDCEFEQASWSHGHLIDSKMLQTKLLTAGFDRCTLRGVAFADLTLTNTQFDAAELLWCRFERVSSPKLSLRLARLAQVSFSDIDFQQLDARGATLDAVTFHRADARHSRLDGQAKSSWTGADTAGSRFTDPQHPQEQAWRATHLPGVRNTGAAQ
jgi:uncharacterized protein YjbI with pentapeptide repeats